MGGDGGHYSEQISGYISEINKETMQTVAEISTGLINGKIIDQKAKKKGSQEDR